MKAPPVLTRFAVRGAVPSTLYQHNKGPHHGAGNGRTVLSQYSIVSGFTVKK